MDIFLVWFPYQLVSVKSVRWGDSTKNRFPHNEWNNLRYTDFHFALQIPPLTTTKMMMMMMMRCITRLWGADWVLWGVSNTTSCEKIMARIERLKSWENSIFCVQTLSLFRSVWSFCLVLKDLWRNTCACGMQFDVVLSQTPLERDLCNFW